MLNTYSQQQQPYDDQLNYAMQLNPTMKFSSCPFGSPNLRIKPKFFKLFTEIITNNFDPILNYLDLIDLSRARLINKLFLALIHEYYQKRLRLEIDLITTHLESNTEITTIFMKDIDSQIPISKRNWLDFDLPSVTKKLSFLNRKLITELRGIKNIGKLPKTIYAPFCIIFGMNKKGSNSLIRPEDWKMTAWKIIASPSFLTRINTFDYENMNENDILEAFIYLNNDDLNNDTIRRYSSSLEKLIIWCQAVVSYHILIHPYTYRNEKSQITIGSDVYKFGITMNELINRFYKFKRFLFNLNIIKIPLGDYVFNLQHSREYQPPKSSYESYLNEKTIGTIFSFLPINHSFRYGMLSKKWNEGFKLGINENVLEILKEIFSFKLQAYDKLSKRIPIIYDNNIFSKYFLMLDDILNSDCSISEQGINYIPFLTKEHLSDIKNIKIESDIVGSIMKVLCVMLNVKAERKADARGNIKVLYLQRVKVLIINGTLMKLMRNLNKLEMDQMQIKIASEELIKYYSISKLDEVKKINRGLYQLLIWELYVFEFLKEFNPFLFINLEYVNNRYEQDEIEMVNYYIEIMNYLKYNLKAKFHFSARQAFLVSQCNNTTNTNTTVSNNNPQGAIPIITRCASYDFKTMINDLNDYLSNQNISTDILNDTSTNTDHTKIAAVYFESKSLIPQSAKPALYERILLEIISTSTEQSGENDSSQLNTSKNGENKLGTIKEENSINDKALGHNANINSNINPNSIPMGISPCRSNHYYSSNSNNNNSAFFLNSKHSPNTPPMNIINANSTPCNINDLPSDLIIKTILFYLDVNSLPSFSLINKKSNRCVKTHIFIRLYFLNREKTIIEQENNEIIENIIQKRYNFYNEYEMETPQKEHSCNLMNQITSDDIVEIKQCFKKFNKTYEIIIAPLVLLLGEKAKSGFKPDGTKTLSYFTPAQKIIFKRDFVKRIRELELETIPLERFHNVENALRNPMFSMDKIKQLSPCLQHLISWFMGVVEFHRVIRKYSLSYYDYEILDENEINFCTQMDNILLWYYKLLRYANKHCKKYEKNAQGIMSTMEVQFDDDYGLVEGEDEGQIENDGAIEGDNINNETN